MRKVMIELSDDLQARITRLAAIRGQAESQLIESALRWYIEMVRDEVVADPAERDALLEAGAGMWSKRREFGSGAGMIDISPDFDEPLDDLKDYQ